MYLERTLKELTLENPTVGDLIEALKQFPPNTEIADTPIEIHYGIFSNEESSRARIGYQEYTLLTIT